MITQFKAFDNFKYCTNFLFYRLWELLLYQKNDDAMLIKNEISEDDFNQHLNELKKSPYAICNVLGEKSYMKMLPVFRVSSMMKNSYLKKH